MHRVEDVDSVQMRGSPCSLFKVSTTNEKANFELERMRIEQNIEEKSSENLLTENGTTSGLEKPSVTIAYGGGTPVVNKE